MAAPTVPDPEILEAADDGHLVDLAMHRALLAPALEKNRRAHLAVVDDEPIDEVALQRAEDQIAAVSGRVAEAEASLTWLVGFIGDHSPGAAAINATGIKLGEVREQLPAIRQAVRDIEVES